VRDLGADQRELFRRWPSGVSVVVAEREGRKARLTVNSLLSVSLEPPLVAVSLALVASLYEVLREAGEWAATRA
jgi:flavin reductase (DIM6/NTAB) family NADH-FMN oxidoreductase RutF